MMDFDALKAELAKPAYNGLTDAQAAVAILTPSVPSTVPVPAKRVARYLDIKGKLPRIQMYARASVPVDIERSDPMSAAMVQAAIGLTNAVTMYEDFDLSDPEVKATALGRLAQIVQTGLIDQADVDAIVAMADVGLKTIAETIGCDDLLVMDNRSRVLTVARARERG